MRLTQFICKVIVTFEYLNEVVQQSQIHGNLSQHLFHNVRLFLSRDVVKGRLMVGQVAGVGDKRNGCMAKVRHRRTLGGRASCLQS